ncbi:MAG: class I SAM-dependent methyltransferase [Holophagales bacterium]|nr:class I SAM-dependent methyltransferase [Holophagales bacterium]
MRNRKRLLTILVLVAGSAWGCGRPAAPPETERAPDRPVGSASAGVGELGRLAMGRTAKGPEGHNFTEVYERYFSPLRAEPIKILEIGIDRGGSLLLWRDYFPKAQVFGIDIESRSDMDTDRIHTFVADQSSRPQLGAFLAKFPGPYDIILDDGGHSMEQQQVSLGFLFGQVRPGGLYIVEDVHTSLPAFYPSKFFAVDADGSNSTLRMLETFVRTGRFESRYMTAEEAGLLTGQVEFSNLFHRTNTPPGITCILGRKAPR